MGLISELGGSPEALLRENSESSLRLLDKYIRESNGNEDDFYGELVPQLCVGLQIPINKWNWSASADPTNSTQLKLKSALGCFEHCSDPDLLLDLLLTLSLYANKDVPWSNSVYSGIAMSINREKTKDLMPLFADRLMSRFLPVSAAKYTTISHRRNGKTRYTKGKAQMPALGLRIPSVDEDNKRADWKSSTNVTVISSVVLLIFLDDASEYLSKCASFALNVLDDSDPLFRAQGCFLLQSILHSERGEFMVRSGLISLFEEFVKTCLSYLPQLTPAETSLRLLKDGAYPSLLALLEVGRDTTYVSYLEVLNNHLLSSISHVSGRNNDRITNSLLAFFFQQIYSITEKHLKLSILACFSRLNFVLCQTITNPYIIESEGGDEIVVGALRIQGLVLKLCASQEDREANELFFEHRLDFVGAWVILAKRVIKFGVGGEEMRGVLRENLKLLQGIAAKLGSDEVELDLSAVRKVEPELKVLLEN